MTLYLLVIRLRIRFVIVVILNLMTRDKTIIFYNQFNQFFEAATFNFAKAMYTTVKHATLTGFEPAPQKRTAFETVALTTLLQCLY